MRNETFDLGATIHDAYQLRNHYVGGMLVAGCSAAFARIANLVKKPAHSQPQRKLAHG